MTLPPAWMNRTATAAAAEGPLPVAWDGILVTWSPWKPHAIWFACDRSLRKPTPEPRCPGCDNLWTPAYCMGRLRRPGDPWEIAHLVAWRCPMCGHDQVYDQGTNESWDLDPDDYGPEGSVARDPIPG